jgi:polysaccharide export outer membrane protein
MNAIRIALIVAVGALTAGCLDSRTSTPGAETSNGSKGIFVRAGSQDISVTEYIVDPPDEITIQSPNIKELDKTKAVVRPDGRIALNLLGEVKVSGKTPDQINKMLQQAASKYYVNPDIKVEVVANSKFYYVLGMGISAQGKKPFTGNDCVLRAVAEALPNQDFWPQQVLLTRPDKKGGKPYTAVINFKQIFEYGDLSQNYQLEQDDIIDARNSPVAYFGFKETQILGPITGGAGAAVSAGSSVPVGH